MNWGTFTIEAVFLENGVARFNYLSYQNFTASSVGYIADNEYQTEDIYLL